MSKELVISANRHETRVAVLDDDQLVEVHFQRSNEYSLAGSIHKGRVTRVLPGMQSAFVDLGLERDTFLYVSDFLEEHEDIDQVTGEERPHRGRERERERERRREQPAPAAAAAPEAAPPEPVEAPSGGELAPEAIEAPETTAAAVSGAGLVRTEPRTEREGGERGDRGDRRGRRSRRRRRGRGGIPESKYAPVPAGQPHARAEGAESAGAVEEPEETAAAPAELPLILPGESLAKYRSLAATPAKPPRAEPSATHGLAEEPTVEEAEMEEEEDVIETEFDEPVHYPPENALPDAPVHHLAESPVLAASSEPISELPPPLPPIARLEVVEEMEEETAEELASEEAAEAEAEGPAVSSILDEEEDRDIQAMILGEAGVDFDEEGFEETEAAEESEGAGESAEEVSAGAPEMETAGEPAAADAAAEALAEPTAGAAEVRERGGRFPHRVSRRNRRRGRGGQLQMEGRPQAGPQETRQVSRPEARPAFRPAAGQPSITDLLKEGQEIIVQIAKEPLGQKGARITSHIALPGRYVVFMPTLEHMGVSRKIASEEERHRLKRVLQAKRPGPVGGFITRTAAEGRTEEEIGADMEFLYNLWQDIRAKAERKPAPVLLHHDLDIVQRILRDQLAESFKAIWIDNEEVYENVLRFVERFQPALMGKVKLYTRDIPVFDAFGVTNELEKALRPKVWLKSGGYIVINQTEALVAIDVNTGKFVGKSNRLEDTIVKTNTEAIKEIVRQIRLRDLGGIIVIDFIDMDERKNRQKVMQALEEAMRVDRAPYKILQFNDFGLVAITRKRVKQSLERTLCSPCPHCEGAGYVKSVQTVVGEILTEARKMASSVEGKEVMLRVHPDVAKVLKSHQNKYLEELEEILRRPVLVKSDALLHHEKFDLA
jgi:ribonuclease G